MKIIIFLCLFFSFTLTIFSQTAFQKDTLMTSAGNVEITFIGHSSIMFTFGGKVIHIDPFSRVADYSALPKADLILITHHHGDHLDTKAIKEIETDKTKFIIPRICMEKISTGLVMKNGDVLTIEDIKIEAVPAYNLVHMRDNKNPFHVKGEGNGYILTFRNKTIYIAGDTENTPEMKALKNIDIAFLPMNVPYTMSAEMVADAARAFKPKILYPYHYGDTDPEELVNLLRDNKDIEVRIRKM